VFTQHQKTRAVTGERYTVDDTDGTEVVNNKIDLRIGGELFIDANRGALLVDPDRRRPVFKVLRCAALVFKSFPFGGGYPSFCLFEIDGESDVVNEDAVACPSGD
jgi:hypothetical protein